ncbi:uncharacterized protein LOC131940755 [Physella acuta]|uniref:uncharacterized protein LOC131940755 n=1 Tax=Physella acuta TaxID=109671 RepID=UPI0027DD3F1B|nr:uncharacterized protein LOC131940755 [Physella acuta]
MRGRRNPTPDQPPPTLPPCKVCGEQGTGFHYGVTTCGACKGFFRRSLVRQEPYVCVGAGNCRVGPETKRRKSCPKCRHEKCLAVGMSKGAIKTGRYSYVKKSHDLMEVIQHHVVPFNCSNSSTDSTSDSNSFSDSTYFSVNKPFTEDHMGSNSPTTCSDLSNQTAEDSPPVPVSRQETSSGPASLSSTAIVLSPSSSTTSVMPSPYNSPISESPRGRQLLFTDEYLPLFNTLQTSETIPDPSHLLDEAEDHVQPSVSTSQPTSSIYHNYSQILDHYWTDIPSPSILASPSVSGSVSTIHHPVPQTSDNLEPSLVECLDSAYPGDPEILSTTIPYPDISPTVQPGPPDNLSPPPSTGVDLCDHPTPTQPLCGDYSERTTSTGVSRDEGLMQEETSFNLATVAGDLVNWRRECWEDGHFETDGDLHESYVTKNYEGGNSFVQGHLCLQEGHPCLQEVHPYVEEDPICVRPAEPHNHEAPDPTPKEPPPTDPHNPEESFFRQLTPFSLTEPARPAAEPDGTATRRLHNNSVEYQHKYLPWCEFTEAELDDVIASLKKSHSRFVGLDSNQLSEKEISEKESLFRNMFLYNSVGTREHPAISKELYYDILESTGLDIDGRKTCAEVWAKLMDMNLQNTIRFVRSLPGFKDICLEDKVTLAKSSMGDYLILSIFRGVNARQDTIVHAEHKIVLPVGYLLSVFPDIQVVLNGITTMSTRLKELKLTVDEIIIMKAIVIMSPDRESLREHEKVYALYWKLHCCLILCLWRRLPSPLRHYSRIISVLTDMRLISDSTSKSYQSFKPELLKLTQHIKIPLYLELFYGGAFDAQV